MVERTQNQVCILRHLSNGMEVYLQEARFSPVFSAQLCVHAGSIDEAESEQGMAHVLEHMLFKGSQAYPEPGEIARCVEAAGGEINAYTTFDRTVYEMSAPREFASEGISLLTNMVHRALLDAEEHKRETEVIVEEIRRGNDNPGAKLSRSLFRHAFPETELARPIIGSVESVRSFTQDALKAFYERWYVPNNMTFVVVGDFDAQSLFLQLEESAHNYIPGNVPSRVRPAARALQSVSNGQVAGEVIAGPYQEVRMQLGLRAPALEDDRLPAWDVFASLLGQGDSSRLARTVKDDRQLVSGIESGIYAPRYPAGLASIGIFCRGEQAHEALNAALECIETLAEIAPAANELARVATTLRAERIYAHESVEGTVRQTLSQLLTTRGLEFEEEYLKALENVTAADVQEIAQHVLAELRSGRGVICAVIAEEYKELITPESLQNVIAKRFPTLNPPEVCESLSSSPRSGIRVSERDAEVRQLILNHPSGVELHINYRKTNRIPAASFGLYSREVMPALTESESGNASLMAQMLTRGTHALSYKDFVEDLENRSASLQSFQGRDLFGLRGEGLKEHLTHLLKLSFQCVFQPGFQAQEFQKVRRETIDHLRAQKDSPFAQLSRLVSPMLYPDHPYSLSVQGTEESVSMLDRESILVPWNDLISSNRWFLSLAGDFEEERVFSTLEQAFFEACTRTEEIRSNSPASRFDAEKLTSVPRPQDPQLRFAEFDREQAHLLLAFRGAHIRDEDRLALEVGVTILSGQGGRLFADLREKQSLAYTVSCSQSLNLHAGGYAAYIGTSADKAEKAFAGLKEHIERLAQELPDEKEVARAKQSLLGSQAIDSQQLSYQSAQLAYSDAYDLGFDHFLRFRERVQEVTPEKVTAALAAKLKENPACLALIGPRGMWQPDPENLTWNLPAAP